MNLCRTGILFLTLNCNFEVAVIHVSGWIFSSVDHGMVSFRKYMWGCHVGEHSYISLMIVCGFNWSPGHCG